jgi:hypothetical protein
MQAAGLLRRRGDVLGGRRITDCSRHRHGRERLDRRGQVGRLAHAGAARAAGGAAGPAAPEWRWAGAACAHVGEKSLLGGVLFLELQSRDVGPPAHQGAVRFGPLACAAVRPRPSNTRIRPLLAVTYDHALVYMAIGAGRIPTLRRCGTRHAVTVRSAVRRRNNGVAARAAAGLARGTGRGVAFGHGQRGARGARAALADG